jgi:hypothetical protein
MRHLGSWLIGISLGLAAGILVFAAIDRPGRVGDARAFEQALTAQTQPAPEAQPPPSSQSESPPQLDPQPVVTTGPTFPVQDSSIESLRRTSARPIWIRIDAIDVAHEITGYGIDPRTGQMDVPNNVEEVAWYEYGPTPGEAGSAVLAAHVDLAGRGPGVFYELSELEEGAIVLIGFDDGTTGRFQVQARTTYLKDQLPLDAIFSRSGPSVLTLITCGGGFNRSASSYDSNVVAYAVPIGDPERAG